MAEVAQVLFGALGVQLEFLMPGQIEYAQPGVHRVSIAVTARFEGER
jgi:hypothetical protein